MATIAAVAIKRGLATERLATAMSIIGDEFGVEPVILPTQGHDATFIHAQQLEALATWAEALVVALAEDPKAAEPSAPQDAPAVSKSEAVKLSDKVADKKPAAKAQDKKP